jgi:MarR family transcriptional regulator, organic hydroperoxide resistance regulator
MAKSDMRGRTGGATLAGKRRQRDGSITEERFPPLSISIAGLVKNGSDREFRELIYALLGFSALMVRHREHFAAYIGVTGPQYSMMAVIAETGRMTAGDIAKQMHVSSQFVTVEISKLARKSIVEKRSNEADRRSVFLSLTPHGQSLLRELGPIRRQSNDLMYRSLTKERAGVLQEIIDALTQDANSALHELDAPRWRNARAPSVRVETSLRANPDRSAHRHSRRRQPA